MSKNSIGNIIRFTSFGESHGQVIGGVLDGLPSGLPVNYDFINRQLQRRKPDVSAGGTQRREPDQVNWLAGIYEDYTTGAPLAFTVENQAKKSSDYDALRHVYRPSHADYTWEQKYGLRDYRGGGRASARETVARVVAGALLQGMLKEKGIEFFSAVTAIGNIQANTRASELGNELKMIESIGFPDESRRAELEELFRELRMSEDTVGGIIACRITGLPAGLGEPIYHKLQADLASAMMSINAVKGFEYGEGFRAASMRGSEHNDEFVKKDKQIRTRTNHSGGIQGGISNGEDILFRLAFKPVSSIGRKQTTVDTKGEETELKIEGRHDVCVVPRVRPVVETMAAMVIADHMLWSKMNRF